MSCHRLILISIIALLVDRSISFPIATISKIGFSMGRRSTTTTSRSASTIDDELSTWASDSGYGTVTSSNALGSSGWASFLKVEVSDPDVPSLFVKSCISKPAKEMFEGEAFGLQAMGSTRGGDCLRIPRVFHYGDYQKSRGSFIVMEYLNLGSRTDDHSLGCAVARMHLAKPTLASGNPTGSFGFQVDNTIGDTPQPNGWSDGGGTEQWIEFYAKRRIEHQLNLAGDSYCSNLWQQSILPHLPKLFEDVENIRPSLLHGDLWSGNIGSADGSPSIFDPAVYWGHHEAEWGMSWCAGLTNSFWEGYRSLIPEDKGFVDRKPLYLAYHYLNHYNLFGGGYLSSARGNLEAVKSNLDRLGI